MNPERVARRKRMADAKKTLDDRKAEGVPRFVSVGRIQVHLRPTPGVLRVCPKCEYEPWKWLKECPKCGTALPDEE